MSSQEGEDLSRLLAEFSAYQRRRGLSPLTISHRRFRVKAWAAWLAPGETVFTATPSHVARWIGSHPRELAAATQYTYLSYLAAFYRWAIRAGHTDTDPTAALERPRLPHRLPRPMPAPVLATGMADADPRMRAWLCLAAFQGFRCIEISRLRAEDIDRERMTIRAHGKGNKDRVVPLHPDTLAALVSYGLPSSGIVFLRRSPGHGPIQPSTISRYIGRHLETATAHQGRHWFATEVYEASGGDLLLTQQLLGHASPATTAIYAEVSGERGRDVIGGLGVRAVASG